MKYLVRHIITLFLLFSISLSLKAQSSSVTLQIVSDGTNITVSNAEVEIMESNVKVISSKFGNVRISGLADGVYVLTIRHPNFKNTTISLHGGFAKLVGRLDLSSGE